MSMSVCLSVCLYVCPLSAKRHVQTSWNFLYVLTMAVAQYSSDDNAINLCYIFPFLWMKSRLAISAIKWPDKGDANRAYTQNDSPGVRTVGEVWYLRLPCSRLSYSKISNTRHSPILLVYCFVFAFHFVVTSMMRLYHDSRTTHVQTIILFVAHTLFADKSRGRFIVANFIIGSCLWSTSNRIWSKKVGLITGSVFVETADVGCCCFLSCCAAIE